MANKIKRNYREVKTRPEVVGGSRRDAFGISSQPLGGTNYDDLRHND